MPRPPHGPTEMIQEHQFIHTLAPIGFEEEVGPSPADLEVGGDPQAGSKDRRGGLPRAPQNFEKPY
jgi:hypothetical protein